MASNEQRGKEALSNLERELDSRDRKEKSRPWTVAALSLLVIMVIGGGIYFAATRGAEEDLTASEAASETDAEIATEEQPDDEANELDTTQYEAVATTRATALPATVSCEYNEEAAGSDEFSVGLPAQDNVSTEGTVNVELATNQGPIGMELDRSVSPCTVNAIEYLAKEGYFDDTKCHRLTTSAGLKVLQCGDPSGTGSGGPGFQFANEFPTDEALENEGEIDLEQFGLPADASDEEKDMAASYALQEKPMRYPRGSIAMANAGLGTNGSQFFLNYEDSVLPPLYTYFGQISDEGLDTLAKIAESGVEDGAPDGAPADEVRIEKATVK